MARPKKPGEPLTSSAEAELAMKNLLVATVELEKVQGQMDLARASATTQFEAGLDKWKARIGDLHLQLQEWYMVNHAALETPGSKSVALIYGRVGRRLGNPTLKPLNKAWTWTAIAVRLRSLWNDRFFHPPVPAAVDKEKVRQELNDAQLKDCGLKVEQAETFFAEPDRAKLGDLL